MQKIKRYLLEVAEQEAALYVAKHRTLELRIHWGADVAKKQAIVGQWNRNHIKTLYPYYSKSGNQ